MNNEVWRSIVGYEGLYEVSNLGQVKRVDLGKKTYINKILNHQTSGSAYPYVRLSRKGMLKKHYIHSLVITAFIGPRPFPKAEVRHFDGIRTNCSSANLSWGTRSQNNLDKIRHGTSKRLFLIEDVIYIRNACSAGISMKKLAIAYNVSVNTIFQIVSKRTYAEV